MKYSIIRTGGKQYRVSEGDILEVEKLNAKPNDQIVFDDVLLYASENTYKVGKPKADGIKVKGKLLEQKRGVKIYVSKFKSKVRYRRRTGHRQELSKVLIEEISLDPKSSKPQTSKK